MTYQRLAGSVLVSLDDDTRARGSRVVMRDIKCEVGAGHQDSALHFTRDEWATFVYEVANELPVDNTAVQIRKIDEVSARWHVRDPNTGATLYFDKDEWDAFRRAAADGALDLSPVDRRSTPGRTTAVSLAVSGCVIVAGVVASLVTSHNWWTLVGLAATAVLLSARVYYRLVRALLPHVLAGGPAEQDRPRRRGLRLLAPTGVFGPAAIGIVLGAATHDWHWVATGLIVSAVLPAVAMLPVPGVTADILPSAEFVFGAVLLLVGVPGVVVGWLWDGRTAILFYGGTITVGGALLSLLTATLLVSNDD